MLSQEQLRTFAERGYVIVPQVVARDVVERASRRIDAIITADPPGGDVRGNRFYFPKAVDEPDLIAPLTGTPAFAMAESLAGSGTLEVPWQIQIALNIPPYPHRPGRPHIDASIAAPTPGHVPSTFTMLAGILMSDQLTENGGNLWVWPGTHLSHAEYFREHGPEAFCGYPDIELPEPVQVTGRAGDLLLAHYLLGHNIGGNYESDSVRRALYFRISRFGHAEHREAFLQDLWLDYDPIRSLQAAR
jgi:hypothetical protein